MAWYQLFTKLPKEDSRRRSNRNNIGSSGVRSLRHEPLEERRLLSIGSSLDPLGTPDNANYLIITADTFYEEVMPLAQWKQDKGYQTHVAKMSDIGSTDVEIKEFIQSTYDSETADLQYVLLVGDHEDVPSHFVEGAFWNSDYIYSLVEGDDVYADLAVGRLPGDTEAQISVMVEKILDYELTPDQGDWYDDVLLAGQFQDIDSNGVSEQMFMEDLNRAADFLGDDYGYYAGADPHDQGYEIHTNRIWDTDPSGDLLYGGWDYPGRIERPDSVPDAWKDLQDEDISDVLNSGVSLVIHRNHGSADGWSHPSFTTPEVESLTNTDALPFVFSLNCSSGMFDSGDSYAEA